jgi:hypothetical protein
LDKFLAYQTVLESAKIKARDTVENFVLWTKPDYSMQWFHKALCDKLDQFERGDIKKMLVFMPPQHGKSELTTRRFPSYLLGKDPTRKIVVGSYSATLASSFNRDIQRIIDNEEYSELFPETFLNESNVVSDAKRGFMRNSEIFETVGHRGFVKTVGRGGALTGTPVDIAIIDDPLKDRAEAESHTIRESLWSWYTDVLESRLHNDSQILIILTRWHEDDLAGRIMARDNDWEIVTFEAIKTDNYNANDHRNTGEALWADKHSLERLERIRENSPRTFNSLYQQTPKRDTDSLILTNWRLGLFDDTLPSIYGLDYGFNPDPLTLVRVAIDRRQKFIYVKELCYKTNLSINDIEVELLQIPKKDVILADHNENRTTKELERKGWNIRKAKKGHIIDGIRALQDYTIIVDPISINYIVELNNYIWSDKKADLPIDRYNHLIDPTRWAEDYLTNKPQSKPIYRKGKPRQLSNVQTL